MEFWNKFRKDDLDETTPSQESPRHRLTTVRHIVVLLGTMVLGCPDPGTNPCEGRVVLAVSRKTVQVTPGFSRNVSVSGIPPFRMEMGPDPTVASALFVDSTVSPAFIIIMAPSTSHIGDLSSFVLSDLCVSETITINITSLPSVTSYSDDIQPIWDLNCQYRGCHPGGGSPFSLDPIVSWSNLYYAEVSNITCGPIYRVVPGNADSSLLYLLISGQSSCPRMPLTGSGDTLSLVDQDLIKSWIEDGAPNN